MDDTAQKGESLAINTPAADLTGRRGKTKPEAELPAGIEEGHPPTAMEGWKGQSTTEEIRDARGCVLTLRKSDRTGGHGIYGQQSAVWQRGSNHSLEEVRDDL